MLTPTTTSQITSEWISSALKITILPETFKLTTSTANGETGFLSDMARVTFYTETRVCHQLILKLLPNEENVEARSLVISDNLDQIEINSYKHFLPELVKIIPELEYYLCRFVYSEIQEEISDNIPYTSILVLQDLKPEGYFMIGFDQDFGNGEKIDDYFSQGLDFLAKFHAASAGLEYKKQASLPNIFNWFPKSFIPIEKNENRKIPKIHSWIPSGFSSLHKILNENSKTTPEMIAAYKELEVRASDIFQNVLRAGQLYPAAIHGDLWTHNVLVSRYPNPTTPVKIIDWQMLGYADPAFDLSIYILESLHLPYLSKENVLKAVKLYYNKYKELLKNRVGITPSRSLEEFETFFQTYGLAYCLFWLELGCPDMCKIPTYIPKVYRIFEIMMEFGLLDFLNFKMIHKSNI